MKMKSRKGLLVVELEPLPLTQIPIYFAGDTTYALALLQNYLSENGPEQYRRFIEELTKHTGFVVPFACECHEWKTEIPESVKSFGNAEVNYIYIDGIDVIRYWTGTHGYDFSGFRHSNDYYDSRMFRLSADFLNMRRS